MENQMETTLGFRVYWGYIGENGKENGNYCSILGGCKSWGLVFRASGLEVKVWESKGSRNYGPRLS